MMYIKYNGALYHYLCDDMEIITYDNSKINDEFEQDDDVYYKPIDESDPNIEDIYTVDFYVDYIDKKHTMTSMKDITRWCVNDNRPIHKQPKIEEDELGIIAQELNNTDGWVIYDKCSSSKIIHLSDCTGFIVKYTYTVKNGEKLSKELIEESNMTSNEFKSEMIKYHDENI